MDKQTEKARDEQQAEIDRLMLEHCPEEMTPEQIANWKQSQVPAPEADLQRALGR